MSNLILLFLCLFLGFLLRKFKISSEETPLVLNQYVIYIALPMMALYYLPNITVSPELLFPVSVAWIGFAFAWLFFTLLGKKLNWSRNLIGALILTSGLGNTSFVGIPVISALYGAEGLQTLIMVDLPGSFVVLSTLGIMVATIHSEGEANFFQIGKAVLKFPPFLVFLIGFTMALFSWHFPEVIKNAIKPLADTVAPIALISVGYQLKIELESGYWRYISIGLFVKLILIPLTIYSLYKFLFDQSGIPFEVSVMEAATGPMITGSIIAISYGLRPNLSSMMVGIGILTSFITMAGWYFILKLG
ncbi:AEC family transporter [Candidatus Nitrosacidococcus tergens]|uniref:Auxin Efflux Carrier n=1 Tax=Candidatus Nitrosacidococcus tergens TaxID=553981 RepID=A0A7G1Q8Y8_9GAMM|nr:AEC family transporter [Candidatus Nitrosacidococcus tergens]CAB1275366.1 Auxin Efflux Carrier [Candidatus Nitrosacidococcus tergens]